MYVKKIKIYIETKTTLEIKNSKKLYFCNVKDFIFNKYICEMFILADTNKIVENQDLYSQRRLWKKIRKKV